MEMGVGSIVLMALGGILSLVGLVGWIVVLIAAFQDEVWKGIVGFICGLYLLYWAIAEYQAPNKWLWVSLWLIGNIIGGAMLNGGMMASGLLEELQ